jgi:hypothetical protein
VLYLFVVWTVIINPIIQNPVYSDTHTRDIVLVRCKVLYRFLLYLNRTARTFTERCRIYLQSTTQIYAALNSAIIYFMNYERLFLVSFYDFASTADVILYTVC